MLSPAYTEAPGGGEELPPLICDNSERGGEDSHVTHLLLNNHRPNQVHHRTVCPHGTTGSKEDRHTPDATPPSTGHRQISKNAPFCWKAFQVSRP